MNDSVVKKLKVDSRLSAMAMNRTVHKGKSDCGRPPSSNPVIGRRDPKPPAVLVLSPSFFATPIGPSRWPIPAQSCGPQPALMDTGTSIMPDSSIIVIKSSTKYFRAWVQIPFLSPNAPDGRAQLRWQRQRSRSSVSKNAVRRRQGKNKDRTDNRRGSVRLSYR